MFKKLLSNLPFNPSLLTQVSFYTQRLRKESFVRGLGVTTMVLALFVQTFAVISPPEQSLAKGPNDIVDGGFSSRAEAVQQCNNNVQEFKEILLYYGVTCAQLSDTSKTVTEYIKSTDYDKKIHSLGRTPQPRTNPRNGKLSNQYAVNIPGVEDELYMKNLWYWDTHSFSTYKVLQTRNAAGDVIFILYDCGNIATVGKYAPVPKPAAPVAPTPVSTPQTPVTYVPGDVRCKSFEAILQSGRSYKFMVETTGGDYRIKSYLYRFGDGNEFTVTTNQVRSSHFYTYDRNGAFTASVQIQAETLATNGGINNKTVTCTTPVNPNVQTTTPVVITDVCPLVPFDQSNVKECYPCPAAEMGGEIACLEFNKTARNDSLGIDDAHGTTAKAGNEIIYALSVKNTGKTALKDFVFKENLVDVLEYANVKDPMGGTLNDRGFLVWPKRDIPANKTVTISFSVKIKDKIPNTPTSASDKNSYDLRMDNIFHDKSVSIFLDAPTNKRIETAAATLPNTGPGETLAIVVLTIGTMGYFFARNKLMVEELEVVRDVFVSGGAT